MLKIGFTPAFMYPDPNRAVFGKKTLNYLEADMAKYFMGKGVMPILIPQLDDNQLAQFINELDGIVLQGGSDIDPTCYNETHINKDTIVGKSTFMASNIDLNESQKGPSNQSTAKY